MIHRWKRRILTNRLKLLRSRDAYAQWASDYPPIAHNKLMEIEQTAMLSLMPDMTHLRVLDLACGTGRYGLIAQSSGASLVIGIDDSYAMLKQSPLASLCMGSMARIPLATACMDVVLCGLAVGHYPDLNEIMAEIARVLVPDGVAVISDFHPFQYLSGARRTFSIGEKTFEVEHYPHLYTHIQHATSRSNLMIEEIGEPILEQQEFPVVLVYRVRKSA